MIQLFRLFLLALSLILALPGFSAPAPGAEKPAQTPAESASYADGSYTGWLFTSSEAVASDYTSLCQDNDGFLWIGTDRGLFRFEGNSYDIYAASLSREGSISDSRVLDLLCDSKGRIWVATANGLNLYDPATDSFRVVSLPSLNFYGYIIAVSELSDGTIIFVVSGFGLFVVSDREGPLESVRYLPNMEEEKNLNTLLCGSDGKIYSGTRNGELCIIDPNGQWKKLQVSDSYITDLAFDGHGNVLVSDAASIFRVRLRDGNSITKLSCPEKIHISRLSTERKGNVFVGTYGKGLWHVADGADSVERTSDIFSSFLSLNTAKIGAVYCAPDDNVWLGCNYYGIVLIPDRPLPFTYRNLTNVFSDFSGGINAVTTWKNNVITALDKGRIAMFSPEGRLLKMTSIPGNGSLNALVRIPGDKLIAGVANDGLYELSLHDFTLRRIMPIEGTSYPFITVSPGLDRDLFVAAHGIGVFRFDPVTGEREALPIDGEGSRLTNSYVASMCRTSDDKLWMGLFGGLACYDLRGDSLMVIDQEPFQSGACYTLAETGGGKLAIGTSHGLVLYDPAKGVTRKFTMEDGLVANDIRDIALDRKGGLWIATLHGLSYFNPSDSTFLSFHGGHGMVENAFGHISASDNGRMLHMSSNLGITSFSPENALMPSPKTKINISGIYLNGRRLAPDTELAGRPFVEGHPLTPDALYLPYKENTLTLRITPMDFRDASDLRYRWQLDGLSKEWNTTAPGDALIYLPHLDPGKYTLRIEALENGVASDPLVTTIHIATPWYISWWMKLIYILVVITVVALVYTLLKRRRQAREDDARIKFFMDVSHDIRSPITLILSPLESLLKEPFNNDVKMKLKTMHRNSLRILSLVNQLLELRKLEKGKMRLSCRLTDMDTFVKELVEMFIPQAREKGLTLTFEAAEDLPEIWVDRQNFDKILVNLISNAIKYTPEGGSIVVRNALVENPQIGEAVQVNIIDTGVGMDAKTEHRLFERFYQAHDDTGASKTGFGIGLDLCRRLIEFHHGVIAGGNRTDGVRGSIFSVALPVGTDAYLPDELVSANQSVSAVAEPIVRNLPSSMALPVDEGITKPVKSGGQRTVLVVDDDIELRDYICSHLAKHYKVKSASDGEEALRIVADKAPDLIVSDVMMPVMDGLSLLQRLKKNADTHHIPVVLLSSKQDIADRMAGWDRGADGYVGKPFHIEELDALVDNLIDNRLRMKGKFSGAQDTDGKIAAPEMKGNDEALMERVMKIIDRNIDDPKLNVEKLAQDVGLSRAHLHRKMKDMVGMTPSDFIRTIRMRRACELLRKGDVAVTQVAYKVGFTSQPHFSTIFKNFTGFTPSEFRDRSEAGELPEQS